MNASFKIPPRLHLNLFALVSSVILLALYFPMFGHEPVMDDSMQIEYVQTFDHWTDVFQNCSQGWFRPFKNIVFYLTLGPGGDVRWTKAAQLSLLYLNGLLAFLLLGRVFANKAWASLGALLLVVNPTMVSNTQFLSVCNNQCCLGFLIIYLYCGIRYYENEHAPEKRSGSLLFGSLLALVLALASYEAAVSAVGVFLVLGIGVHNWHFLRSRRVRFLAAASTIITGTYLVIRDLSGARGDFFSPSLPPDLTAGELILRAPYYLWQHFLMWILPWGRGGAFIDDDPRSKAFLGIVLWLVLTGCVIALLRLLWSRYRLMAAGLLIFIGGFVPLGNFLGLGNGPICNYYLIVPSLGLVLAFAEALRLLASGLGPRACRLVFAGLALLFLGYIAETRHRIMNWRDDVTLFRFTLGNYPDNYHALTNLGLRSLRKGNLPESQERLRKARELAPWYIAAVINEAYAYAASNDLPQAIQTLENFNREQPQAPWLTVERLAEYYLLAGRLDEVGALMPQLFSTDPDAGQNCRFHIRLVVPWMLSQGRTQEAIQILQGLEDACSHEEDYQRLRIHLLEKLRHNATSAAN